MKIIDMSFEGNGIGKDNNKTTWALSVLMSESTDFEIPQYINESNKWVYGQ